MKKYAINKVLGTAAVLAVAAYTLQGCKPDIEAGTPSAGAADFSNFIAVGNSLTAGFADNGLNYEGQATSYPLILAQAMQATGKGPAQFLQPLFPVGSAGTGGLRLAGITNGLPVLAPVFPDSSQIIERIRTLFPDSITNKYAQVPNGMEIHNLGVPGIRVADIESPVYGVSNNIAFNPFFERMLPDNQGFMSYLSYVAKRRPTFFTNWLGNNDVLGYASAGGTGFLTNMADFTASYGKMLDTLTRGGAKGLIATVPKVTSAPYFTTVPPTPIVLTDPTQVALLNGAYAARNAAIKRFNTLLPDAAKLDTISFRLGPNAPVIAVSVTGPDSVYRRFGGPAGAFRQLRADRGELILLPAQTVLPTGAGTATPLGNQFALTREELDAINARTNEINTYIRAQATSRNLALFDAEAFLDQVKAGQVYFDGTNITAAFVRGGAFSLDGIHPTPRGYALIANEMMKAINAKYGSNLSPVNAANYPALQFPK